jgi:hypothetical protein
MDPLQPVQSWFQLVYTSWGIWFVLYLLVRQAYVWLKVVTNWMDDELRDS